MDYQKDTACQECNSALGHTFDCTTQKIDIPRYDLEYTGHGYSEHRDLVEQPYGDWVKFEDVVKLLENTTQKKF